jgi:molecular chaperone GrpE
MKEPEEEKRDDDVHLPETVDASAESPSGDSVEAKLESALKDVEMYRDQLLRTAAEFANYKRRMEAELRNIIENANERLLRDLLPVLDDFDRFQLSSKTNEKSLEALVQGVDLIRTKMCSVLAQRGLKAFESVGQPFDVDLHDALLQVPREDVPPHTVIEEVSKGYHLNDKVLRHAKVVVSSSNNQAGPPLSEAGGEVSDQGAD